MDSPAVPVSWGELLDKIAILEIKRARIERPEARANVAKEHRLLGGIGAPVLRREPVAALFLALKRVNEELWEIEDAIRREEALAEFGAAFVRLARSVYRKNDERAALKRRINLLLDSDLVEEKSYAFSDTSRTPPSSKASVVTDAGSQSSANKPSSPSPSEAATTPRITSQCVTQTAGTSAAGKPVR